MKSKSSFILAFLFMLVCFFAAGIVCHAEAPSGDISKQRIQDSDTYFSYDYETRTLTLSGSGAVPSFTNSSGISTSQPWFSYRSNGSIEHVVVEEGITSLGNYCLYSISAFDVSLPNTLERIGSNAMGNMGKNKSVAIPNSVSVISDNAFKASAGLESVIIPESVKSVGVSAFENCSNLSHVEFTDCKSDITISRRAFFKCPKLIYVEIPKNATLKSYSFAFYDQSSGSVYDDAVLGVYRDSDAYTYAVNNIVNYVLLDSLPIAQGEVIDYEFFNNSLDSTITFTFSPSVTADYEFFSNGDTDVKCRLVDSQGTVLAESDNVSLVDTDFYIRNRLESGSSYQFVVSTNNYAGAFSVSLMPAEIMSVTCSVSSVELSASDRKDGRYDVLNALNGASLTIDYGTDYRETMNFIPDSEYRGKKISYSDDQENEMWMCGSHTASVSVGEHSFSIAVTINHSYTQRIVEPTYTQKGYTIHSCVGCSDVYYSDYTASLGMLVKGRAVLMESPDGAHPSSFTLSLINVCVGDEVKFVTENNGEFEFLVDAGTPQITLNGMFAVPRTLALVPNEEGVADLGDIALMNFDYNPDGYINAKDFALIRSIYRTLDPEADSEYTQLDYNHDYILNDDDWIGAGAVNFYTYGKVDETIYNNLD